MYTLVRRFIKTAVVFLGVGLATGLWIMVRRVCGVAQVAGVGLFFFTMWPRIRAAGSGVRETKGERF